MSSETARVNRKAFRGVPRAGSMAPNHAGSSRARPMLNRRRLLAMKKPLIPVKIAMTTATLKTVTPAVPRLAVTVAPVAQAGSPATSSRHGQDHPGGEQHHHVHSGAGQDRTGHQPERPGGRERELLGRLRQGVEADVELGRDREHR